MFSASGKCQEQLASDEEEEDWYGRVFVRGLPSFVEMGIVTL
jgi:hypothetical protein